MANTPSERYQTANEFREALRCVGRVDSPANEDAQADRSVEKIVLRRRSPRAIAAALMIMLASFAVFCHYYRWRMPAGEVEASTNSGVENLLSSAMEKQLEKNVSPKRHLPQRIRNRKRQRR